MARVTVPRPQPLTVRGLIKQLQSCSPDDLACVRINGYPHAMVVGAETVDVVAVINIDPDHESHLESPKKSRQLRRLIRKEGGK